MKVSSDFGGMAVLRGENATKQEPIIVRPAALSAIVNIIHA
jgi:hypothetical protein